MKDVKVIQINEGGCGTLVFGASGIPIEKMENELKKHYAEGWEVKFMVVEKKRMMLAWKRESVIVTLERERSR